MKARRTGNVVDVHKRETRGNKALLGAEKQKLSKLDGENETRPPPVIERAVVDAIIKGRVAKGWSQEELARRISVPVSTIKQCETPMSRKPDLKVIRKLEKELEIYLQGESNSCNLPGSIELILLTGKAENIGQPKVIAKKVTVAKE
ncbi:hypothetical protein SCHPADRAFT_888925 [Schizopora paradoxa]|uniref:HTH cro/C1-type domain-containing protein n=1 Tax=Schizopora paradoxa TaxID=27342 RepID=A0A0H2SDA3_9AGAM|nr:hypothetical protein SCHPADRAFT_888925 [Schizopora paradoxa]